MNLKNQQFRWSLVAILLIKTCSVLSSEGSERHKTTAGRNGEGLIESYMMARDVVQDLMDRGVSPDPNGEEMQALNHWRDQLLARTDLSQEDLRIILKGDPGVDNSYGGVKRSVKKRTIERSLSKRWPGGVVPFVYTSDTNSEHQREIRRAMEHYHRFSCIRFVPWEIVNGETTNQMLELGHPGYLKFVVRNGCWSHQGNYRWADGQEISCCGGGTCIHELGHALGELHEQQSPNPDRNRFIRVNPQYIKDTGHQWYAQRDPDKFISHGYDLNSRMHYAQWMFGTGSGDTFTKLFPELRSGGSFYYQVREVSIEHKCQHQCDGFPLTCDNDGYLTKVDDKCACRCIPGLDPATGCKTTYQKDPPGLEFPGGRYALPAHKDGCPDGSFTMGSRIHFNSGGNEKSARFSLKTNATADMVEESFCISNRANNDITWPEGNYCIYRKGGSCPEGFFSEGSVKYDDKPTNAKHNSFVGELPDGEYGDDTKYQYCCKNTGFDDDALFFPSRKPLVLIKRRDENCQNVRGMHLEVNSLTVGNAVNNTRTVAALNGDHPVDKVVGNSLAYSMKFCAYKPAMLDCGGVYELDSTTKQVTFRSPDDVELECVWLVKAPAGQRLALDFTEFDIAGSPGSCTDDLVVRYSRQGQPGLSYCGTNLQETILSINNTIHIQLSTYSGYRSRFTAKVRLIEDRDLCYNSTDRGMTYAGDVNFTRTFQPCLPWHEMTHCEAHPFKTDIYNILLTGNECRTPDQANAFQPWCYTDKDSCARDYCDVCLIGNLFDRSPTCEETRAAGECPSTSSFDCAKTCFDRAQPVKAADVRCPFPPDIYDGKPVNPKESYAVGEAVTYKCDYMDVTRDRLCLSTGRWASMGTVCTECPQGWHMKADTRHCYRYFDTAMSYAAAVEKCEALNAQVSTSKTQEENEFVLSLTSSPAWLGLTDDEEEGTFVWVDGTLLGFSNWTDGEPNNWANSQDCVELTTTGRWNDRSCKKHYSVVCKRPAQDVQFCLDFWDKCGELLALRPKMCDEFPDFAEAQCRQTCGICSANGSMH